MWNEDKQRQFDELRNRKFGATLTAEEQLQLQQLSIELDMEDEAYLRPAFEYSRQRQRQLDDKEETKRLHLRTEIQVSVKRTQILFDEINRMLSR
jgi:Zn-dependent M16 (insulinase) family peptidase